MFLLSKFIISAFSNKRYQSPCRSTTIRDRRSTRCVLISLRLHLTILFPISASNESWYPHRPKKIDRSAQQNLNSDELTKRSKSNYQTALVVKILIKSSVSELIKIFSFFQRNNPYNQLLKNIFKWNHWCSDPLITTSRYSSD